MLPSLKEMPLGCAWMKKADVVLVPAIHSACTVSIHAKKCHTLYRVGFFDQNKNNEKNIISLQYCQICTFDLYTPKTV